MIFIAPLIWIQPEVNGLEKTDGGIILTTFTPRPKTGTVVGIGIKCDPNKIGELKVGDRIAFNPDHITSAEREIGDNKWITIPEDKAMAIIPPDAKVKVEDHEL